MREPFSVHTPADSPYGVLFAFSTASSGVRNVRIERTGPKISSRAIRWDWLTPVKSVGRNQNPRSGRRHSGWNISAPSSMPDSTSSSIFSSCCLELIAPTSVFLSSGSPTRRVWRRALSLSRTGSNTDSWTSRREPAQQTWPWLK